MKRIALFIVTNIAILFVLNISMRVLGLDPWLSSQGINMGSLLLFAAAFGMGGAFISLAISKWTAKKMTGAQVIDQPSNQTEAWLVGYGAQPGRARRDRHAPRVAIYDAPGHQRLCHRHEAKRCVGCREHRFVAQHGAARNRGGAGS